MGGSDNRGGGLASQPRRYRCQGNPFLTGIRWGVSPVAQMGCLCNRSGSPLGVDCLSLWLSGCPTFSWVVPRAPGTFAHLSKSTH